MRLPVDVWAMHNKVRFGVRGADCPVSITGTTRSELSRHDVVMILCQSFDVGRSMPDDVRHSFADDWLLCFKPRAAARRRLVCFGPAGGGASFFRRWPDLVPPDVEVLAVQLPGRETRLAEPPEHDIVGPALAVGRSLMTRKTLPTVLFGHSMGALLALETARGLRQAHFACDLGLVVSGRESPDLAMQDSGFMALDDDAFLAAIDRRYGGIPPAVMEIAELRELIAPVLRADFAAVIGYRDRAADPLDIEVTVMRGRDDPQTADERIAGWGRVSVRPVRRRDFPGGHFYLSDRPEAVLAEVLSASFVAEPS
ncbi:thioesterase II family protein [Bradyrhizobium sp. HKCCYLR20261]|uniref:thioesterase II family protein n=1 Tax=unclassified Bradyrhizobium TaxID=2631580 RepID=UPI003EBB092C